jgi:hypothetical protein
MTPITDRRTIVTRKHTLIYSLVIFCSLSSLASPSASYATCTPVVYAFRHAEDKDVDLQPLGYIHAQLYIGMVTRFQIDNDYCPVRFVYSMYYLTKDGDPGTNNPYETAQPLAATTFAEPLVEIGENEYLDEHFESTPGNVRATKDELRSVLAGEAKSGASIAIFWSRQGLPDLGDAISPGTMIPSDSPRNATYVFRFNESGCGEPTQNTCFDQIPSADITKYIQCFNVAINFAVTRGTKYYCGHAKPNLETIGIGRDRFEGRICDGFAPTFHSEHEPDYYGYCE